MNMFCLWPRSLDKIRLDKIYIFCFKCMLGNGLPFEVICVYVIHNINQWPLVPSQCFLRIPWLLQNEKKVIKIILNVFAVQGGNSHNAVNIL